MSVWVEILNSFQESRSSLKDQLRLLFQSHFPIMSVTHKLQWLHNTVNDYFIQASCCDKLYCCKKCHNDNEVHEFGQTIGLRCAKCHKEGKSCSCHKTYKADCRKCGIVTNKLTSLFHCEYCKKCYAGKREDYKHCHSCDICIGTATTHK